MFTFIPFEPGMEAKNIPVTSDTTDIPEIACCFNPYEACEEELVELLLNIQDEVR